MILPLKQIALRYIELEIIDERDWDWFVYGLEKRVSSAITVSAFLIIAAFYSNIWIAVSFLGSFYSLRERTSGYHAITTVSGYKWVFCVCGRTDGYVNTYNNCDFHYADF